MSRKKVDGDGHFDVSGEVIALRTQNGRLLDRMELLTRRMEDLEDSVKLLTSIVNAYSRKKCPDPKIPTSDGTGTIKSSQEQLISQITQMMQGQ